MRSARTAVAPAAAAWVTPLATCGAGGIWPSVGPCPGWDRLDVARHGVEVHRAVVEARLARAFDPHQRVLHPVHVIALRKILARVRAAALGAVGGRMNGGARLQQQVLQLEGLDEIGVPDERTVADMHIGEGCEGLPQPLDSLREALAGAK